MPIVKKPYSVNKAIAIKQPQFTKIETETKNGFAFNASRINIIEAEVVMDYNEGGLRLNKGDKVLLRGDSGLQDWAKFVYVYDKEEFVLCPESRILGYLTEAFEIA